MSDGYLPQPHDFQKAFDLIKEKSKILLVTHSNPDGDAIGSMLAMYAGLKKIGKNVEAVCASPLPTNFSFLENSDKISEQFKTLDLMIKINCKNTTVDKVSYNLTDNILNLVVTPTEGSFALEDVTPTYGQPNFDLIISLDTPELDLLGEIYSQGKTFFANVPLLNIDHHASNQSFGTINIINSAAPSTGEIVYSFFKQAGLEITPQIATALLAAVVTDTGSFQHVSTTANSFSVAGHLMELGGQLQTIIDHVYRTKSLSTLKLWGRVLSNLKQDSQSSLVWSTVSQQDLKECNAKEEQAEGVLNELMSGIPEARVALLLYEYPDHTIRGSIRAAKGINASDLAATFGGGGHEPAAGFRINDVSLEEAEKNVVETLKQKLATIPSPATSQPLTPEQIIDKIGRMMEKDEKQPAPPPATGSSTITAT